MDSEPRRSYCQPATDLPCRRFADLRRPHAARSGWDSAYPAASQSPLLADWAPSAPVMGMALPQLPAQLAHSGFKAVHALQKGASWARPSFRAGFPVHLGRRSSSISGFRIFDLCENIAIGDVDHDNSTTGTAMIARTRRATPAYQFPHFAHPLQDGRGWALVPSSC